MVLTSITEQAASSSRAPAASLGISELRCRECGRHHDVAPIYFCEDCFGPLEVVLDLELARAELAAAPPAAHGSMWRFAPLLPASDPVYRVDIGAGGTPLRHAPRLAAELGVGKVWLKLDLLNPTNSFKDRVVSVALSAARAFGFEVAACASTGNLANSVAAHAAATGMRSVVFIPHDLEAGKVAASRVYGGEVVAVKGSYDDVNRLCAEAASQFPWAFVNVNLRPYYAEGSKTLAFEVAQELGWRTPDALVAPVASGALLTKVSKGFRELEQVGLIGEDGVRLFGAQAEGCAPVAAAFDRGDDDVVPVKPATIAKSIAIGNPGDGIYALREVRARNGGVIAVAEADVPRGIELLARTEGVFTETAGGVAVAALEKLTAAGRLTATDEVVVLITGHGLKTVEALAEAGPTRVVAPRLGEIEDLAHARETKEVR